MRDEAGLGQGQEISEVESGIRIPQEGSTSVTFASLVWWPGCETACAKNKLCKIQRLACLGITRAMWTTPLRALEALICLPPLEIIVQGEARMTAHRLRSLG